MDLSQACRADNGDNSADYLFGYWLDVAVPALCSITITFENQQGEPSETNSIAVSIPVLRPSCESLENPVCGIGGISASASWLNATENEVHLGVYLSFDSRMNSGATVSLACYCIPTLTPSLTPSPTPSLTPSPTPTPTPSPRCLLDMATTQTASLDIVGASQSGRLGGAYGNGAAAGDFNGDGFDDLLLGEPVGNPSAYILYGNSSVFLTTSPLELSGAAGTYDETRIFPRSSGNKTGYAAAAGDLDGDGLDDVLLGAPYASNAGAQNAGAVEIVFGSKTTTPTIDLNNPPPAYRTMRILGPGAGAAAGLALAAGDINADGFEDVVIGAHGGANPSGSAHPGAVFVVYGQWEFPNQAIDLSNANSYPAITRIYGNKDDDLTGWSVAAGDVNGDGYDDIIIGAPEANPQSGRVDSGGVYVIYGSGDLKGQVVDLSNPPGYEPETRIFGAESQDATGGAVDCGDVNGDGYDDIVIGAPYGVNANRVVTGRAYVVYGAALPKRGIIDLAVIDPSKVLRIEGVAFGDSFGSSAAAADGNGDGLADILIGAPRADFSGRNEAGKMFLLAGLNSRAFPGGRVQLDSYHSIPDLVVIGGHANDLFGSGVADGGDLDGDGQADYLSVAAGYDGQRGAVSAVSGRLSRCEDLPTTAWAVERFRPGAAPARNFGGPRSPVIRARISFWGGDNGQGAASVTTVTLARLNPAARDLGALSGRSANVLWRIETDREGFSPAEVSFQYLDSEIAGTPEEKAFALSGARALGAMVRRALADSESGAQ